MNLTKKQVINCLSGLNQIAKEKLPIGLSRQIEIFRTFLEHKNEEIQNSIEEIKINLASRDANGSLIFRKDLNGNDIIGAFTYDNPELANNQINNFLSENIELEEMILNIGNFPNNILISADTLRSLNGILQL